MQAYRQGTPCTHKIHAVTIHTMIPVWDVELDESTRPCTHNKQLLHWSKRYSTIRKVDLGKPSLGNTPKPPAGLRL